MQNYTLMNDNLFYCRPWDNKRHKVIVNGYTVIVSDLIWGNEEHSVVQLHIAFKKGNKVVKIFGVNKDIQENKYNNIIQNLQKEIQGCMCNHISWTSGALDNDVIKIWYYRPEADPVSNENDLYLRIAITAVNINSVKKSTEEAIINDLKFCLQKFVKQNLLS